MGWYFAPRTLQQVTDDLLGKKEYEDSCESTLLHTISREGGYYVLWSVAEVTATRDATINGRALRAGQSYRYIRCDLLQQGVDRMGREEWGYKPLCEAEHPAYYSCPLGYLRKAPVANQEWRDRVREYHKKWRRAPVNYRLLAAA